MSCIQLENISLRFGNHPILKSINLSISFRTRMALVGVNGSGKSTLMKVAAGLSEYDEGQLIYHKNTRSAYLPQSGIKHSGHSLRQEIESVYRHLALLEEEKETIAIQLENKKVAHENLLKRYQKIEELLEFSDWNRREARIEQILIGLGFLKKDFDSATNTFSGGWQMRIALAKILLESPDILFLDEPTNYLDLEAREWLRDFLKSYKGGLCLVSHDRSFLDEICNQVSELFLGRLKLFPGNYTQYEKLRENYLEKLLERQKNQKEERKRIELFINRFRYKDSKAAQVQSRIKMLEKLETIEMPPILKRLQFRFPSASRSVQRVLQAEELARRYADKIIFSSLNFELERGSRTAVVGINGAGKTTLLRIISGEDKGYTGKMTLGKKVQVGYFSQDQERSLNPKNNVLEEILENSKEGEEAVRQLLGSFLFSSDDIYKKTSFLSGGERNRLALLKILLEPVNFLILDEPTNHLDMQSKEMLLEALENFGGSLLIVSHDRYFLGKIANQILEINAGRGKVYQGNYQDYRWQKEREREKKSSDQKITLPNKAKKINLAGVRSHEEQKKRRSLRTKLQRQEKQLCHNLTQKENQAQETRTALEKPENYSDHNKARELALFLKNLEKSIQKLNQSWEKIVEEIEAIPKDQAKT